jgi:hypothetical protein
MKKITFLMLSLAMAFGSVAYGQKMNAPTQGAESFAKPYNVENNNSKVLSIDTLWGPTATLACGDSLTYYSIGAGNGYLTGNNKYGDLEKGMLVKNTTSGTVTGVVVGVIKKGTLGTSTCAVNIYSKGADNLPATLLGTSETKLLSSITTTWNTFTFATPVAVTGDFFATLVLPTNAGDTLVVLSTKGTCMGPDSSAVEKWFDAASTPTSGYQYLKSGWGFNGDLCLYTILQSGSATVTYPVNFSVVGANGTLAATVDGTPITTGALVESGKNVVFTAAPAATYVVKEWKNNSTVVAGNTTNNYTLSNLTAAATVSVEFKLPAGVETFTTENVKVFASNNQITVQNNSNVAIDQVVVYNMMGQEVATYNVANNGSFTFNANLASANYIVKVLSNNAVNNYKIFVQ